MAPNWNLAEEHLVLASDQRLVVKGLGFRVLGSYTVAGLQSKAAIYKDSYPPLDYHD